MSVPLPSASVLQTPSQRYQGLLARADFQADPAQQAVVAAFDRLQQQLLEAAASKSLFERMRERLRGPADPVQGLYVWGSVGRGKTMLMDLFYDSLPQGMAQRMHFHRFMHRVHGELKALGGQSDPLAQVAARLAGDAKVLCFDEFFVSDIGDAMILAEMLRYLFEQGVSLVATSNVVPARLYENGLQRSRFVPAIELLQRHCQILELASPTDYRLRVLQQAEIYHWPLDVAADASLEQSFRALAPQQPVADQSLTIEGREIPVRWLADDVAWFEFDALCEGPRSQVDYIELSRIFHAVVISNVPQFSPRREDAARRFIALVDEFYDRNVKLVLSAAAPVTELYAGERLRFEFERTASRLIEMQSEAYLGRTHKA